MSSTTTDFLSSIRQITRLHEAMLRDLCERYHLTLSEAAILSFLHNNPGKDTAADIVELRGLKKSNVSPAVESLYQKNLITRRQDRTDRRRIHLTLTRHACPIAEDVEQINRDLRKIIFLGLTPAEVETFCQINQKIRENTRTAMERRELK